MFRATYYEQWKIEKKGNINIKVVHTLIRMCGKYSFACWKYYRDKKFKSIEDKENWKKLCLPPFADLIFAKEIYGLKVLFTMFIFMGNFLFSVVKATLQSQMSVHSSVCSFVCQS